MTTEHLKRLVEAARGSVTTTPPYTRMWAEANRREDVRRRIRWLLVGAAIMTGFAVLGMLAPKAGAQPNPRMPCHNATEVAKQLTDKYDESPVAMGLQSNGNLLQIYSSDEKDTWTVVSTTPTGMSCIVAAGKRWTQFAPVAGQDS